MMDCLKGLSTSCYASNPTFSICSRAPSWPLSFFTLLHVLISLHLSTLTFTPPSLSLTLLYEPKRWSQPNLYDERCLAEPGRSHTYNKSRQRYIIKQKHHNSRPHDWCYTSSKSYISTDWSIINKLIWSHVHLQKLEAIRS